MIKLSTALRQGIAVGDSFKDLLDGGFVHIYTGAVPASADAAIGSATLLCKLSVGGDDVTPLTFESTAPGGILSKKASENWTGNNLVSGTPTFFRYVLDGDAGDASTTAIRFQGSAGGLGSDMFISSLPLVADAPQSFSLFQIAIPEQ